MRTLCECADPGCPVHNDTGDCQAMGHITLFRVDMEDITGTVFCEPCSDDAIESGLFSYFTRRKTYEKN